MKMFSLQVIQAKWFKEGLHKIDETALQVETAQLNHVLSKGHDWIIPTTEARQQGQHFLRIHTEHHMEKKTTSQDSQDSNRTITIGTVRT